MTIAVLNATRSPRDLETFTKKVADGKKATTDFLTAEEFFKRLPGWRVERVIAPMPLLRKDRYGSNSAIEDATRYLARRKLPHPQFSGDSYRPISALDKDEAKAIGVAPGFYVSVEGRLAMQAGEVRAAVSSGSITLTASEPKAVREDALYFAEATPMTKPDRYGVGLPSSPIVYLGPGWLGRAALRVTAPSVTGTGRKAPENPTTVFDDPKDAGVFGTAAFWSWAKGTTLAADAKALLESLRGSPEEQADRADRERLVTLDQSGVCAVCFRKQKFHGEGQGRPLMYDHGYQIPPGGYWTDNGRVGSCSGVGLPPYEVSAYGTKKTLDRLTGTLKGLHESREKLNHATMIARTEEKTDERGNTVYERDEVGQYRRTRNYERIPVRERVEYTPSHPKWERVLAVAIAQVEAEIRMVTGQVAFYTEKVASWRRVPTYDEQKAGRTLYRDAFAR